MRGKLVGLKRMDYTNKQGRPVQGYTLMITYPSIGVQGLRCSAVWLSDADATSVNFYPTVGQDIVVDFADDGRLSHIENVIPAANGK